MPTSPNQKMKLLYLMRILMDQTDENHSLTIKELIDTLAEYGVIAERKSIYSDFELLRQYGIDIERRQAKTFSYYVASRQFELPELKLLVDAVQSSHFITSKKSNELIKKLSSLTNNYQAKELRRQVFIADRPKAINESVYYNIDAIHTAINSGFKINYRYFDYNQSKLREYRRAGELYTNTPIALCWNDDKYYLVSYTAKYDNLSQYRVDRMSNVSVCEEKADSIDKNRFNIPKYVKQLFGMYSGDVVRARLRFDNSLINSVLDRFGVDIKLINYDHYFEIDVSVSESPVFFGWITQFGRKAEIIGPDSLREAMRELVREIQTMY